MAATASLKLTVDDYLALPEDGRHYKLIDGDLVVAPAPLRERYLLQEDPSQPEGIYRLGEHETIVPACLPELTLRLDGFLNEGRS